MPDYVLMTIELGGFLGLAALLIGLFAWLRSDMAKIEARLRDDIKQLAERVGRLDERVARLDHSQAKLEGLLEGLREAITGRSVA